MNMNEQYESMLGTI